MGIMGHIIKFYINNYTRFYSIHIMYGAESIEWGTHYDVTGKFIDPSLTDMSEYTLSSTYDVTIRYRYKKI